MAIRCRGAWCLGWSVFPSEAELDFFDLFCTVDKVGARKALKAMVRPVKEIADAIQRQDAKWLTTLPGVGAATAEQIIATLRRKVTRFALMAAPPTADGVPPKESTASNVDGNVIEDAYQALLSVGHGPGEARTRLDKAMATGQAFKSVEEVLLESYKGGVIPFSRGSKIRGRLSASRGLVILPL